MMQGGTNSACGAKQYAPETSPVSGHARLQNMLEALFVVRDTTQQQQLNRLYTSMDFVLGSEPQACAPSTDTPPANGMVEQIREVFLQIGGNLNAINNQLNRLERVAS